MKVWRVISLTLWSIVLISLLLVSGMSYLLSSTVLNQSKATAALGQTHFYDVVRTELLLPEVQKQLSAESAGGTVLPPKDVLNGVEQVFTADKVRSITDQVLGATYQWTNKKAPDIDFSISVASEKEALAKALEAKIGQNVSNLPRCSSSAEVPSSLADATCLPPYVSQEEASTEAVSAMRNRLESIDDTITPETLHLTGKDLGSAINTPDYLGYLRALNFVTLPLALIISVYLLFKRRGAGLAAIGASLFVIGIIGLSIYSALHNIPPASTDNALDSEIIKASQALVEPALLLWGGIGMAVGACAIVGGIFWQRATREKHA